MSVHKLAKYEKDYPYTRVPNDVIRDENLDLKSLGLLLIMLSKPNDWVFRERQLAEAANVGRDALRSAMQKLIDAGYVRRFKTCEPGETPKWVTEVYDTPIQAKVGKAEGRENELRETRPISKTEGSKKLADGKGGFYVRSLAEELAEQHNREVQLSDSSLGETYLAVARTASQVFDEKTYRGQIIGLTVELLERAFGSLPKNGRGMVARLVATNKPITVLEAAVRTTGAAVGADERYADDPLGPVRYLAGILRGGR